MCGMAFLYLHLISTSFTPSFCLDNCSTSVKAPPMVGPTWTRVCLTLGSDCSPLLSQGTALLLFPTRCFIVCSRMSDVQWYRVVLVHHLLHSWFMYAPLRVMLLDHVYIHLHGSLYPMMDYVSCVYYGLFTPCLLMFHGVRYNSFATSYCTWFVVL